MVQPDKILKELSKLWVDLGHEEQAPAGETGAGVLRACAMTLIALDDESERKGDSAQTVAMLMKEHPSRAILIRLHKSEEKVLDSRVFAQCWMPFGQRRQICCEQIEITASDSSLDDVPGVVLPLTVPDLPVILWNRSPRLFETSAFPQLAAMCDKVIVDTGAFSDPQKALGLLSSRMGGARLIADLAWARITRWRETVSQIFMNRESLEALPKITSARVTFGGEEPRTEALYLAGWLQNGLRQVGSKAQVELAPADGPAVTSVTFSGTCELSVKADRTGAVVVHANRLDTRTVFPEATDQLTLQEELSITTRDAVFEQALEEAKSMGERVVKA